MDQPDLASVTKKLLDLSTGHIELNDTLILDGYVNRWKEKDMVGVRPPITIHSYDYGYYIPVPDKDHWHKVALKQMREDGASEALVSLIDWCVIRNFALLCFDRDGLVVEGLPKFEW